MWITLVCGVVTRRIILTNSLLLWSVNADKMSSQHLFGSNDRWSLWVILACSSVSPRNGALPGKCNCQGNSHVFWFCFLILIYAHRRCPGIIFWALWVWEVINSFEKLETLQFILRDIQNYTELFYRSRCFRCRSAALHNRSKCCHWK